MTKPPLRTCTYSDRHNHLMRQKVLRFVYPFVNAFGDPTVIRWPLLVDLQSADGIRFCPMCRPTKNPHSYNVWAHNLHEGQAYDCRMWNVTHRELCSIPKILVNVMPGGCCFFSVEKRQRKNWKTNEFEMSVQKFITQFYTAAEKNAVLFV